MIQSYNFDEIHKFCLVSSSDGDDNEDHPHHYFCKICYRVLFSVHNECCEPSNICLLINFDAHLMSLLPVICVSDTQF